MFRDGIFLINRKFNKNFVQKSYFQFSLNKLLLCKQEYSLFEVNLFRMYYRADRWICQELADQIINSNLSRQFIFFSRSVILRYRNKLN